VSRNRIPPILRVSVITGEAGGRYRTESYDISRITWRYGREAILHRLGELLDAADAALEKAERDAPVDVLP
jgi:hypothetical protein